MFDVLLNKEYMIIALMALFSYILLSLNPAVFQNKRYKADGNDCPNAAWHAFVLLLIGTGMYVGCKKYACIN